VSPAAVEFGLDWVWRPRKGVRILDQHVAGGGSRRPRGRPSPGEIARLDRVVRKAPEVMVKVSGRTYEAGHLKAHLDYITRNGKVEAESNCGLFKGREEVAELHADWVQDGSAFGKLSGRPAPLSVNMVLSMPAGIDRERFRDAVTDFVEQELRPRVDVVLCFHHDTAHPHAHVTVRGRDDDGKTFNPNPATLHRYRERFAACLRLRGVEAEATPRSARGVGMRNERSPLRQMERRGETPRLREVERREVLQERRTASTRPRPWEDQMRTTHAAVRTAYQAAATALAASADPAEQELAGRVASFVQNMDVDRPLTRRDVIERELDREAGGAAEKPEAAKPEKETAAPLPGERQAQARSDSAGPGGAERPAYAAAFARLGTPQEMLAAHPELAVAVAAMPQAAKLVRQQETDPEKQNIRLGQIKQHIQAQLDAGKTDVSLPRADKSPREAAKPENEEATAAAAAPAERQGYAAAFARLMRPEQVPETLKAHPELATAVAALGQAETYLRSRYDDPQTRHREFVEAKKYIQAQLDAGKAEVSLPPEMAQGKQPHAAAKPEKEAAERQARAPSDSAAPGGAGRPAYAAAFERLMRPEQVPETLKAHPELAAAVATLGQAETYLRSRYDDPQTRHRAFVEAKKYIQAQLDAGRAEVSLPPEFAGKPQREVAKPEKDKGRDR
jgi:type IV secretion system T-DNA border endonuclease VirD2